MVRGAIEVVSVAARLVLLALVLVVLVVLVLMMVGCQLELCT